MAEPSEDLGSIYVERMRELDDDSIDREWEQILARSQSGAQAQAPGDEAQPQLAQAQNPTPELQDPSAPNADVTPGADVLGAAGAVGSDVGRGTLESPRQAVGGAVDALRNMVGAVKDVADLANLPGIIFESGKGFRIASGEEMRAVPSGAEVLTNAVTPDVDPAETFTGGAVRNIAKFATGLALGKRLLPLEGLAAGGTAAQFGRAAIQGAIADFGAFDPDEQRLADLVEEFPALSNPVTQYLQSDPADSDAEGRFKNALEGLGLGVATEVLFRGVRALRSIRQARSATLAEAGVTEEAADLALGTARGQQAVLGELLGDPAAPLFEVRPMDLQGQEEQVARAITGASGTPETGDLFINWNRISGDQDVKAVIQDMADAFKPEIDTARRGVRTWEETKLSASQLDAWKVLQSRRAGEPLNAESTRAVRELWARSGAQLRDLAVKVNADPSEMNQIALRKMMAVHATVQEQVLAARTETARALNIWGAPAGDDAAFMGQIDQIRALAQSSSKDTRDLAKRLTQLAAAGDDRAFDAFASTAHLASGSDMIRQLWYNSLLSSPLTHTRNVGGTTGKLLLDLGETMIAEGPSVAREKMFGLVEGYRDAWRMSAKMREMETQALDLLAGGDEAGARAILAAEADDFASSALADVMGGPQKVELSRGGGALAPESLVAPRKSLKGRLLRGLGAQPNQLDPELVGIQPDGLMGGFFTWLDTATSAPSRAMMREDEFLKSMAYQAEIRAQAYRQAVEEVASGRIEKSAFKNRLGEIIASPDESLRLAARSAAEVHTFTNQPLDTKLWNGIRGWHNIPVLGDITLPFSRTPYNIATQVIQRTPLAPFSRSWVDDIKAGGTRGKLAWTRFAAGNAFLLTAADLTLKGHLTGAGPSDPSERALLTRMGWKPFSLKIGDRYFEYGSISPVGSLIGLSAATTEILAARDWTSQGPFDRTEQMVTSTTMAIAAQVADQSFMSGAASFFNAMSDPQRYGERWWQQLASSALVPRAVAHFERIDDPEQRVAWDIADTLRSQVPGLSKSVPLRRDAWGRKVSTASGLGWVYDLVSPLRSSPEKAEPIDRELARLRGSVSMPDKKIGVQVLTSRGFETATVDLWNRPDIYSRYLELSGQIVPEQISGKPLLEALNDLVEGRHPLSGLYSIYSDGPDGGKMDQIDDLMKKTQRAARERLVEEFPELRTEATRKAEQAPGRFAP